MRSAEHCTGAQPARLIRKDLGGFNGFEVGPDGMLYGPLWFKGEIVKVNLESGATEVIASGFKTPAGRLSPEEPAPNGVLWVRARGRGRCVRCHKVGASRLASSACGPPAPRSVPIAAEPRTRWGRTKRANRSQLSRRACS